ncbi:hypothetical protein [Spiroplasma sp. BIUS-1]|uniref:hypothetical protein n=1 Tax=Spiroplasma sp. BIUS-1 TaxID=216964 RepID=UPI001398559F|nr:hypothetical protein [Spiroplasma sp. BIUS-1]QHX36780.1 hypothetical protein SBIUS_v1c05270 [Spiroplasma sp. BIUS-1]
MWFLYLVLVILAITFTILGCKMASKGNPWGILVASIGIIVIGTLIAYCLFEQWKKENLKSELGKIKEKLGIIDEDENDEDEDDEDEDE